MNRRAVNERTCRLAEFFLHTKDPRKLPTRQRFVDLVLDHFQIPSSACNRIPYGSGWLPAYRLTPAQPKGTVRMEHDFHQTEGGTRFEHRLITFYPLAEPRDERRAERHPQVAPAAPMTVLSYGVDRPNSRY